MIDPAEVEVKIIATIRREATDRGWIGRELVARINEQLPPACQIKVTRGWAWCSPAYRVHSSSGKNRGAIPTWFVAAACRALESDAPADHLAHTPARRERRQGGYYGGGTPSGTLE